MHGIHSSREKKGLFVGDIDISSMDCKNIILEIKNRLEFICNKTKISKRKLSNILDKPDGYIAHRFSYNDKLNLTVIIEIIKIFGLSLDTLFLPKKEDFLIALSDTQIIELKDNVQTAYEAIEIRQLKKEINIINKKIKKDKLLSNSRKILLSNRLLRKSEKLKEIVGQKKLTTQSEDEIKSYDRLLSKLDTLIERTKADLATLKN